MKTPAEAAAECDFGKPSARKSGRNPKWPYVPVIVSPTGRTTQIRMRAFATRAEAVAYSETYIAAARAKLEADLAKPNMRALRRHHGVE